MLKYVLLGFLNYAPMTGYELESYMSVSTEHFWHARLSQVYMTLKKLEEENLVTSEVAAQEGRPDRRIYTLTEAGRADLLHWLAQPLMEIDPGKDTLLVKLFFGRPIGKQAILTQLRIQLELHKQVLERLHGDLPPQARDIIAHNPDLMQDALLWRATQRMGQLYEEAYVQWLEETIVHVQEQMPDDG